ncbi:MAG: hypothetical protein IJY10_11135 [Lachnospiraceae bacterium]|nr:hypothetical protein [Lachnospiraceae bacterium]
MKKKLALLMVMTTVLLAACGKTEPAVNQDETGSSVAESSQETTQSSEEVVEPEAKAYVPGTYTDNKYESTYVGYTFTAPEGCTFMSPEELAAENGIDADTFAAGGEALETYYEQASNIIDFNASMESGASVYMNVAQMLTHDITLEEYTQVILGELTSMTDMTCTLLEEAKVVQFMGRECTEALVSIEMEGITLYQKYFMFVEPTYTGTITVTYADGMEAEKDALIAGFAAN